MQYEFYKNPIFRIYAEIEDGCLVMRTGGAAS
ncbi:MAG: hypothetical protein QG610_882, partial [Euryarchaeota archaeon]|nr:hypothetical protein [Euryarchaeota archaeon]